MKKKILAIVLCIAMLAIMIAGGTMAYFTDTKTQTNTFTAGKVKITLDEAELETDNDGNMLIGEDGNPAYTGERTDAAQSFKLFPAMEVTKDPTITLVAGSEDAYLAAVVTVTIPNADLELMKKDPMNLVHPGWKDMLMVGAILDGGVVATDVELNENHKLHGYQEMSVYSNATYSVYQDPYGGQKVWNIYMFFEGAKSAPADAQTPTTVTLFDTIKVPDLWNNDEMAVVNGMTIDVAAYAVQANGFDNCYDAMIAAFEDVFPKKPATP